MLEVGGLPEGMDDDIAFNKIIRPTLPELAHDALRFTQQPKKPIENDDPDKGVKGCKLGRLVFGDGREGYLDLQE
eukprot:12439554-Alexandrium_andersonii.AAC.1